MPQLEEDEWPADEEPTTTEQEHLKDGGPAPPRGSGRERRDWNQGHPSGDTVRPPAVRPADGKEPGTFRIP
jgi:hypothetical protein